MYNINCQKLQELQSSLSTKFQSMDTSNGPSKPICFHLPNGQQLHQCFYENITMRVNKSVSMIFYDIFVIFQELYEYILSTGQIEGSCFTLFQSFSRCEVFPLKHVGKATLKLLLLKSTITHRIFLSFLKIAWLVLYADKCYSNIYNIHISFCIHRIHVMTMNLIT